MAALDARDIGIATAAPPRRRRRRGAIVFWLMAGWIVFVFALALLANLLPLDDPSKMTLMARRAGPSMAHLLGTDAFGRDILSRLVFGARNSLAIGILAPLLGTVIGGALGLIAGYFGGRFETLTIAASDVLLAFPPLVLALAVVAYLGASLFNLIIVLGLLTVPAVARVARAATLTLRERDFVTAARALGASNARILMKEILPNVVLPLSAFFLVLVAVIIVAEGILSFLGLGVPPPSPSWGGMIAEGRDNLDVAPHIAFIPSVAMFLTVLAFNLVGDTLRAATDPRRGAP
ncbi:MAG TPA: ABC transporter permease [Stellaceae bacterium]|nr:ABC transporter permease [Stellaceae bacterium]